MTKKEYEMFFVGDFKDEKESDKYIRGQIKKRRELKRIEFDVNEREPHFAKSRVILTPGPMHNNTIYMFYSNGRMREL